MSEILALGFSVILLGEGEILGLILTEIDCENDCDGLMLGDKEGETLGLIDLLMLGDKDGEILGDDDKLTEGDAEGLRETEIDGLIEGEKEDIVLSNG